VINRETDKVRVVVVIQTMWKIQTFGRAEDVSQIATEPDGAERDPIHRAQGGMEDDPQLGGTKKEQENHLGEKWLSR
jgi:hypothetical protein